MWYDGGGAFQQGTFGYLGRPGGRARKIGTSYDVSAEYTPSARTTLSFYGGIGRGGAAPGHVFPAAGEK